jgi:hypothetical protein
MIKNTNKILILFVAVIGVAFIVLLSLLVQKRQKQEARVAPLPSPTATAIAQPIAQNPTLPPVQSGSNVVDPKLTPLVTVIVTPTKGPGQSIDKKEIVLTAGADQYPNISMKSGMTAEWKNSTGQTISLELTIGNTQPFKVTLKPDESFGIPLEGSMNTAYKAIFPDGTTKSSSIQTM